jgi:hypothetical protein
MEPIRNAKNIPLHWVQPKTMARYFILHSGEHEYATLDFQSAFGSLAISETAEHTWSFKRMGFFNPRVTVRRPKEDVDLAVFQPHWTSTEGTLTLANGRNFQWRASNFWATKFVFQDSAGEPLLWFLEGSEQGRLSDLFKTQALLEIESAAWQVAELDLLVTLGWYLLLLYHEDIAGAAAASSAT